MFKKITTSCKYVMNNSRYVKINYDILDKFIDNIEYKELKNWLLYNPYNLLNMGIDEIINFLLIFESIDYSFWGDSKWSIEVENSKKDGSDALLYIMLNYIKTNVLSSFENISFDEFKKLLSGNVEIPLLRERFDTIKKIYKIVNEQMNGNFYNSISQYTTDEELFEYIINNFDCFKDEREYNGHTIYFYKLAQLLTSDILHLREELEKISVDYSNLIGCADYKIPQTLRALGIIEYNEELSEIVDSKREIKPSSEFEVEIRASQIVVLDYIKNHLKGISSMDINDYLFMHSKKVKDIVKPYHLCRNTNY